jgi:hypothetical protein
MSGDRLDMSGDRLDMSGDRLDMSGDRLDMSGDLHWMVVGPAGMSVALPGNPGCSMLEQHCGAAQCQLASITSQTEGIIWKQTRKNEQTRKNMKPRVRVFARRFP